MTMDQHRVTDLSLRQVALASQGTYVSLFWSHISQRRAGEVGFQEAFVKNKVEHFFSGLIVDYLIPLSSGKT